MNKIITGLLALGTLLAPLQSCGASADIYAKVCLDTDPKEPIRAKDEKCQQTRSDDRFRWRYYRDNIEIPAVGWKMPMMSGQWKMPDNAALVYIPEKGGNAYREFHSD